jgi:hypothetical protein
MAPALEHIMFAWKPATPGDGHWGLELTPYPPPSVKYVAFLRYVEKGMRVLFEVGLVQQEVGSTLPAAELFTFKHAAGNWSVDVYRMYVALSSLVGSMVQHGGGGGGGFEHARHDPPAGPLVRVVFDAHPVA